MQERRDRGLCYYYDEKYQPGHKCNRLRIYLLEGMRVEELHDTFEETFEVYQEEADTVIQVQKRELL
ncbi:hypothetical protein Patl1_28422 [Pistacia atlantica]|uniref:Uncharacterized protein n=1 Tax=Pistacia atlantica TaxID=434234 RepID=A0ACC1BGY2_9ROSI|nr:hypothetical protein Patl1_28422 [Pistacia atlantica]